MLFHTWPFLAFFAVVYGGFLALKKTPYWLHWLLAASYFFYGWWNPLYLLLIVYSTVLDYAVVAWMDGSRRKTFWLLVSIVNNLALLGFFKYAGFVTENFNFLLAAANAGWRLPAPDVLLPVGISFYTFQSMSYTIDFYRGEIKRERSFVRFATFVSLFPQLVAGPIERAKELLPQLNAFPRIRRQDVADGLSLFVVGLFKKVALADYLAAYADPVFATPDRFGAPALLLGTVAFAWQIYFDFSGYTDMARGVARAMGYKLMVNFNHPYLATSLGNFWSRWHISLSTWFRDYVYIPLGGNRHGPWRTYFNLFVTMVVSGLWHGAAWTFIIWGALHAVATVATREAERSHWYHYRVPAFVKRIVVFAFVCFAWIFFRASTVSDAWLIVARIFSAGWRDPRFPLLALLLLGSVWVYQFAVESPLRRFTETTFFRVAIVVLMLVYLCVVPGSRNAPFIYFQF
ncbi:MAG: MBOAT family protein [Planctomycetales bacterium]|nr:MBOAT family protein [Planctomycetales bacterium]